MFPASLLIYERSNDFELNRDIEYFWAGDKIKIAPDQGRSAADWTIAKLRFSRSASV